MANSQGINTVRGSLPVWKELCFHDTGHVLPILTLDPGGQELPQFHGEAVAVQVVELLQIPGLQLLQLVPLSHPDKCPLKPAQDTSDNMWGGTS